MQWYWRGDFLGQIQDEAIEEHLKFGEPMNKPKPAPTPIHPKAQTEPESPPVANPAQAQPSEVDMYNNLERELQAGVSKLKALYRQRDELFKEEYQVTEQRAKIANSLYGDKTKGESR